MQATIAWGTMNPIRVWEASMVQVPATSLRVAGLEESVVFVKMFSLKDLHDTRW